MGGTADMAAPYSGLPICRGYAGPRWSGYSEYPMGIGYFGQALQPESFVTQVRNPYRATEVNK